MVLRSSPVRMAVVPVAGLGSRLLPLTKAQPKEMLPLGRKPVLQHVIEELAAADIRQILLITGRRKRSVEDHFDEDGDLNDFPPEKVPTAENLSVSLFYIRQPQPLGSGHAVKLAQGFTNEAPFLVAYGDSVIWEEKPGSLIREMVDAYERYRPAALIAVQKVSQSKLSQYGVVAVEGWRGNVGRVAGIIEKPPPREAPSHYAVSARYLFTPLIYEALQHTKPRDGEWQLTDAIHWLIDRDYPVLCVRLGKRQRWDVGNFLSYFVAFVHLALNDPEVGDEVRRAVRKMLSRKRSHPV